MAQKLAAVSLLIFLATQTYALPSTNNKISETGDSFEYSETALADAFINYDWAWGFSKCTVLLIEIQSMYSSTSATDGPKKDFFECVPKAILMWDIVTNMLKLYGDYRNVKTDFDKKRNKCKELSSPSNIVICLKQLEVKEKETYQKISDRIRELGNDLFRESKELFGCIFKKTVIS